MSADYAERVFLREAMHLMATYLFAESVELQPFAVGVGDQPTDDTFRFLDELEARHAIACAKQLESVLPLVERKVSSRAALVRQESRGIIRGRLDTGQYIANRARQLSLPREYPILATIEVADTPENTLVGQSLRSIGLQLARIGFPRSTAEGQLAARLYSWIRSRLRRWPWSEIHRFDSIERLEQEARQRVRKRQTGNDRGYESYLGWLAEWRVDLKQLGSSGIEKVTDGLLAFPTGDFFWNKVFEVWTLKQIAESLQRCGCVLIDGPMPLHRRAVGPIFRLSYEGADVRVWFQRQEPLGPPMWRYVPSYRPLAGIPDVVITADQRRTLIVDAKYRAATTDTRPEETYKMLGYFQNFSPQDSAKGFEGILVFVGPIPGVTRLVGPNESGRLTLLVADQTLRSRSESEKQLDASIMQWLDARVY